jgi:hypothetical protein
MKRLMNQRDALHKYIPPEQVVKFLNERRIVVRRCMDKAGLLKKN